MVGGDFETVAGPWVVRGEVAAFPRDAFQAATADRPDGASPSMPARRWIARRGTTASADRSWSTAKPTMHVRRAGRTDVSLIVSADRTFSRAEVPGPPVWRLQSEQRLRVRARHRHGHPSRQRRARGFARLVRRLRPRYDQPVCRQRLRLRPAEVLLLTMHTHPDSRRESVRVDGTVREQHVAAARPRARARRCRRRERGARRRPWPRP